MNAYHTYTDQELIALIQEGDHHAFSEIHDRYFKPLFRSAFNVLGDSDACMDIVQDVFVWFWEHRDQHAMSSIKGYLLKAVKYQSANYIRKGKVRDNYLLHQVEQLSSNEERLELKELQRIIELFVNDLPEKSRQIFQMSREQQMSNKEIAVALGITEKTVSGMLARSLKKLKGELGKMHIWMQFFM